jgi:hypothetical protein
MFQDEAGKVKDFYDYFNPASIVLLEVVRSNRFMAIFTRYDHHLFLINFLKFSYA